MPTRTKERSNPYINLNGLAKYQATTDAVQRERILRDFKYPEPEGYAQGDYYSAARSAIRRYHERGNDQAVLLEAAARLERLYVGASDQEATKLENNIRVLRTYHAAFGSRKLQPIPHQPIVLKVEGVELNLRPDMLAMEKGRLRVIRFGFRKEGASAAEIKFTPQLLYFYSKSPELTVKYSDCQFFVLAEARAYSGTGIMTSFEPRLRGTLREIRRLWADL